MTTETPNLEEAIRGLATRGEISHISLTRNSANTKWRGSFTMCSKFGVSFSEDADPVKALMLALTTAKMKPARVPKRDDHQVETIPQDTVDVENTIAADVASAEVDQYLAGINAKIEPVSPTVQADIDALM